MTAVAGSVPRAARKGEGRDFRGDHRILGQLDRMEEQPGQAGQEEQEPDSFQGLMGHMHFRFRKLSFKLSIFGQEVQ